MSKYFKDSEMVCHCCGRLPDKGIDPNLYSLLDDIRDGVGGPLSLSCAYRCPEHNAETPGSAPNSAHVLGQAADIIVPDGMTVEQLAELAESLGADGVGRYYDSDFVHVDVRSGRICEKFRWTDRD